MSDGQDTIWPLEPHTRAKHGVLTAYLKAWVPILSRQAERLGIKNRPLRIIDGFAGPGIYEEGEYGSPILALRTILDGQVDLSMRIRFMFIEKDKKRHDSLQAQIDLLEDEIDKSSQVDTVKSVNAECEPTLIAELNKCRDSNIKPGPAFFFLDQFGYSHVSMNLIERIMSNSQCEVFTYLHWKRMNPYLTDPTKWEAIHSAFGSTGWKAVLDLPLENRATFMREKYKASLRDKAGAKYTWHIAMCDENHTLTHWLFFCTNNLRGLEEMKKAMWSVDRRGCFQFSDKDNPDQFELFENYSDQHLASDIRRTFAGCTLTVGQIKEFVLTETPEYRFKRALKIMESSEKLSPVNPPHGRRKHR